MAIFTATANSNSTIGFVRYGSSSWGVGASNGACQGSYQGTTANDSRVGIMVFSGLGDAVSGMQIDSIRFEFTTTTAGKAGGERKGTFHAANVQSFDTTLRGGQQVGEELGVILGISRDATTTHILNSKQNAAIFEHMAAYFAQGNSVLIMYNGETSSSTGYSENYMRISKAVITVEYSDPQPPTPPEPPEPPQPPKPIPDPTPIIERELLEVRLRRGVTLYDAQTTDFTTNGKGILMPISGTVDETENGVYGVSLSFVMKPGSKWTRIQGGDWIKVEVPMRPLPDPNIEIGGWGHVPLKIYSIAGTTARKMYARPLKQGESWNAVAPLVRLDSWYYFGIECRVRDANGLVGYIDYQYISDTGEVSYEIVGDEDVYATTRTGFKAQLFRITSVVLDSVRHVVDVDAEQAFYDLNYDICLAADAEGGLAGMCSASVLESFTREKNPFVIKMRQPFVGFDLEPLDGDVTNKNFVEILLDPQKGMLPYTFPNGLGVTFTIIRDNFDIYIVNNDRERSITASLRLKKNINGVRTTEDFANVYNRIIPIGEKMGSGDADLLLDTATYGHVYVESPNPDCFPVPRVMTKKFTEKEVKAFAKAAKISLSTTAGKRQALYQMALHEFESVNDSGALGFDVDYVYGNDPVALGKLYGMSIGAAIALPDDPTGIPRVERLVKYRWDITKKTYTSLDLGAY